MSNRRRTGRRSASSRSRRRRSSDPRPSTDRSTRRPWIRRPDRSGRRRPRASCKRPPPRGFDPPLGYAGRSGVVPRVGANPEYLPVEDRWRIGFPAWDRYDKGSPWRDDYPYQLGQLVRPVQPERPQGRLPDRRAAHVSQPDRLHHVAARGPAAPDGHDAVREHGPAGRVRLLRPARTSSSYNQQTLLSFDLFHGDAAFKPVDWRLKITPVFNVNTSASRNWASCQPGRDARGPSATAACGDAARVVRRSEAGRPQPRVRLRVAAGRLAAVHQRLPRLHLQRHEPRPPGSSARSTATATSSTWPSSGSSRRTPTAS